MAKELKYLRDPINGKLVLDYKGDPLPLDLFVADDPPDPDAVPKEELARLLALLDEEEK